MTKFRSAPTPAALLLLAGFALPARAQVVNPATVQKPPEPEAQTKPEAQDKKSEYEHLGSWELPPTVVREQRWSLLREEDLIGDYGQPRWTATRRFPTTRVYVVPAGQIEYEFWMRPEIPRHGSTTTQTQHEWEIGLGGRFQLDLYLVGEKVGNDGSMAINEQKFELRYALADWGQIALNPTLYFEVALHDQEATTLEGKLLFGDEMAPSWHWGANLVFESETGGDRAHTHEITAGISKTLKDEKFSLGAEMKAALTDVASDRGEYEEELLIGPSLQYRPMPRIHMDLAPLVGIGPDSPVAQIFFVLGYEF